MNETEMASPNGDAQPTSEISDSTGEAQTAGTTGALPEKDCANLTVVGTDSLGGNVLDLQPLECTDPTATYRIASPFSLPDPCQYSYGSVVGKTGTTCLDLNLAEGECLIFAASPDDADRKVDCLANRGVAGAVVVLASIFNQPVTGEEPQACPPETTHTLELGAFGEQLYCFGAA